MASIRDIVDILDKIPVENWKKANESEQCFLAPIKTGNAFISKKAGKQNSTMLIGDLTAEDITISALHRKILDFYWQKESQKKSGLN